jgi:uncharacterized membrane protein (UPF0127 family)
MKKFKIITILTILLALFVLIKEQPKYSIEIEDYMLPITHVFDTPDLIIKGLSGVKNNDFNDRDIALFIYEKEKYNSFWMPNTFFPLTIIFMDKKGLIVGKETLKNFPAPLNSKNKKDIPITGRYESKYVIEIRSDSSLSKLFKLGEYISIKKKD